MSETVRITVAPNCYVTITPHPSGIAVLRSLTLGQGNTADVTPARAAALFRAGLILNPMTGEPPPAPEPMRDAEMTITIIDGLAPRSASGGIIAVEPASEVWVMPAFAAAAHSPPGNHNHGQMPQPAVTYRTGQTDEMATITTADGRPWPSY